MNRKEEYEKYMKLITDNFIAMQSDFSELGNDKFKVVSWKGGKNYKMIIKLIPISGNVKIAKKYNADIAMKYIKQNSFTYDEWNANN